MQQPVPPVRPLAPVALERDALRLVLRGRRAFLQAGIVAQAVAGVVLAPALLWLLAETLTLLRADVVLNFDLASLALSPTGVLLWLAWSVFAAVVGVIALGVPCAVAALTLQGRRPRLVAVARHVFARLPSVPGLGALKLSAWFVLLGPAAAAAATALAWLLFAPFGGGPARIWIPKEVAQLAWIVPAVVVLGIVAFLVFVRWSVALPCLVLERVPLSEAMRRSARLVKPRILAVGRVLGLHLLVGALVVVLVTLVAGLLSWVALAAVDPEGRSFAAVVALCLVLDVVLLTLATIFSVAHGMAIGVLLHARLSGAAVDLSSLETTAAPPASSTRRARVTAGIVVLLIAGATAATVPQVRAEIEGVPRRAEVTAHRGASGEAPENSLSAIERAIAIGAQWTELDFQQCADGTVVMLHDQSLQRTAGVSRNVWEMTLPELRELDVGSWFDERFAGERIATFEEVLATARGRIGLNIELKTHGHETDFVARVVASLREAGMTGACVITSLDLAALAETRRLAPELRIGAILTASVGRLERLDVDFYSVQPSYATIPFVRTAHEQGRGVHVWTLNDAESIARHYDRGVDNVITDEPALALRLLRERGPAEELEAAVLRMFRS